MADGFFEKGEVGRLGEEVAASFLKKRGLKIIERNWKAKRWGELDVIAKDKDTLVFVEVKTRRRETGFEPFEQVDYYKIQRLLRTAKNYLAFKKIENKALRLDVVSVVLEPVLRVEYFQSIYQEE